MRIQDLMRAASVKRWTIVTTSRDESLAEHSFLVLLLARDIALRAKLPIDEVNYCIFDAISHDLHEIHTGDVPTPAKEKALMVPTPRGKNAKHTPWSETSELVVKFADLIQAWWFISQWGTGRHAEEVAKNCHVRLSMMFENFRGVEGGWTHPVALAAWDVFRDLQEARHEL